MTNDHRSLIEEARREHRPFELDGKTFCYGCTVGSDDVCKEADSAPYPCISARLADALEQADKQQPSVTLDAKVNQTIFDLAQELDAALASLAQAELRAAEQAEMCERQAAAVRHHTSRGDALADRLAQAESDLAAARKADDARSL